MSSVDNRYNRVNGTHASENRYLIQDILRKEWGSDATVMSDWFVFVLLGAGGFSFMLTLTSGIYRS